MIATLSLCASLLAIGASADTGPGSAIFWSPKVESETRGPEYRSQTRTIANVVNYLEDKAAQKEILVVLCSDDKSTNNFFQHPTIAASVEQSGDATILPYVYHTSESVKSSVCSQVLESGAMKSMKAVSPSELTALLAESKEVLNNGVLDSFLVSISSTDSTTDSYRDLFEQLDEASALIVALQNPTDTAPTQKGNYRRILSSDVSDGDSYLPEGSEFTIFYENQYLYLTPDIFTGLMTGLFMFFVLLIGYNCLGSIQGPATFAKTLPSLGKEG